MKFVELAQVMEDIEACRSTTKMRGILATFLKRVPSEDIAAVAYMLAGAISAEASDLNLGVATKMMLRSIEEAFSSLRGRTMTAYKRHGDVGLVAQEGAKARPSLLIQEVYTVLHQIARTQGKGSADQKVQLLAGLLKQCSPLEARYLSRIVVAQLRLGSGRLLLLDALAVAYTGDVKNRNKIEAAYNVHPDIGEIARKLKLQGLKGIQGKKAGYFAPIKMMLAQRAHTIEDIKKRMDLIVAEEKYDGERIQAHKVGNKVVLFSRRLEDITTQFPDIVEAVKKGVKAKSCILDGEAVPVDEKGNYLPFQLLMQRRRKYDVQQYVKRIPVKYMVFDVLKVDDEVLMALSYLSRRKVLESIVKESRSIGPARQIRTPDMEKVKSFFHECVKRGTEGIIAKSGDKNSPYRAGAREWSWIKWKKDYVKGLMDTFDLVVVGAYRGRGRRAGSHGALLCAAYNPKARSFETLCKVGTGFSDDDLKKLPSRLKRFESGDQPSNVRCEKAMMPDRWYTPGQVVELEGAELTLSSNHTCAREQGRGYALRFPRFLRYRDDKSPKQATTTKEIKEMAKSR